MANPLVVLLVVAAGHADDVTTRAIASTAQSSATRDVVVVVRELDRVPDDAEAIALARAARADVVVEVAWDEATRRDAVVHVHSLDPANDAERTFGFEDRDQPTERGRAVGLAISAMLPKSGGDLPPPPAAVADPSPTEQPAPTPSADTRPAPVHAAEAHRARRPLGFAVDVEGSAALAGTGGGLGGLARFTLGADRLVAARALVGYRASTSASVYGQSAVVTVGAGGAVRVIGGAAFELAVGADLFALRESVSQGVSAAWRWLPGVDATLTATYAVGGPLAVVADVGAEIALGTSRVLVDGRAVATFSRVRPLLALGARFRF